MTEEIINKITKEIRERHHQIIDDWCKAYMAQLHQEGHEIKPGSFTLNEMVPTYNKNGEYVRKYWFECNTPKFDNWIKCSDKLPDFGPLVLVTDGKTYALAISHEDGTWWIDSEISDMQTLKPKYWMPLPDAPKEEM